MNNYFEKILYYLNDWTLSSNNENIDSKGKKQYVTSYLKIILIYLNKYFNKKCSYKNKLKYLNLFVTDKREDYYYLQSSLRKLCIERTRANINTEDLLYLENFPNKIDTLVLKNVYAEKIILKYKIEHFYVYNDFMKKNKYIIRTKNIHIMNIKEFGRDISFSIFRKYYDKKIFENYFYDYDYDYDSQNYLQLYKNYYKLIEGDILHLNIKNENYFNNDQNYFNNKIKTLNLKITRRYNTYRYCNPFRNNYHVYNDIENINVKLLKNYDRTNYILSIIMSIHEFDKMKYLKLLMKTTIVIEVMRTSYSLFLCCVHYTPVRVKLFMMYITLVSFYNMTSIFLVLLNLDKILNENYYSIYKRHLNYITYISLEKHSPILLFVNIKLFVLTILYLFFNQIFFAIIQDYGHNYNSFNLKNIPRYFKNISGCDDFLNLTNNNFHVKKQKQKLKRISKKLNNKLKNKNKYDKKKQNKKQKNLYKN